MEAREIRTKAVQLVLAAKEDSTVVAKDTTTVAKALEWAYLPQDRQGRLI
jgi:hypothetical protein